MHNRCHKQRYISIIRMYVQIYVWCMESSNDSTKNHSKNYQNEILNVSTINPIWEIFWIGIFWYTIRDSIPTTVYLDSYVWIFFKNWYMSTLDQNIETLWNKRWNISKTLLDIIKTYCRKTHHNNIIMKWYKHSLDKYVWKLGHNIILEMLLQPIKKCRNNYLNINNMLKKNKLLYIIDINSSAKITIIIYIYLFLIINI